MINSTRRKTKVDIKPIDGSGIVKTPEVNETPKKPAAEETKQVEEKQPAYILDIKAGKDEEDLFKIDPKVHKPDPEKENDNVTYGKDAKIKE